VSKLQDEIREGSKSTSRVYRGDRAGICKVDWDRREGDAITSNTRKEMPENEGGKSKSLEDWKGLIWGGKGGDQEREGGGRKAKDPSTGGRSWET